MNKREWLLTTATAMVATGREFDTKVQTSALSAFYDAIVAASPEPADGGWIEHRGEKPYPEGLVEYETRDGTNATADADDLLWEHGDNAPWEIVKWRPAT